MSNNENSQLGRAVISARSLTKAHRSGSTRQIALNDVSLDLYEGDFTVIMGPSGAGKSTLLHVLGGMDRATSGTVTYNDVRIDHLDERGMARLRRSAFEFVFQQSRLVSNLTLLENAMVAGFVGGKANAREVRQKSTRLLDRMGVEQARDRLPAHVSGGEARGYRFKSLNCLLCFICLSSI